MRRVIILVLLILSLLFASENTAESFTLSQVAPGPGSRSAHGMAFDPYNNVTVVYGGSSVGGGLNAVQDTWFYDYAANSWTEYTGASPPARTNTAMVYCDATHEMILYGGQGAADTWSFDCESQIWTEVVTSTNPGVRHSHALAYDPIENVVILFGGFDEEGWDTDETWSFDCETREWTELFPSEVPLARYGHVMTYDTNISRIILSCGNTWSEGHQDDTWTFDVSANTWTEIDTIGDPNNLKWPSMVYDSINQKSILFGGQVGDNAVDATQVYDAFTTRWANPHPEQSPPARINSGLAFDSMHGIVILYGGLLINEDDDLWIQMDDTWTYSYTENVWTEMTEITNEPAPTRTIVTILLLIGIPSVSIIAVVSIYLVRKRNRE